jgi:hypothetical protein
MENVEENFEKILKIWKKIVKCEMRWKIWKKGKLNSDTIWKIWKKIVKCKMIWKIWKKGKSNSDKIWKLWKKIVKRYGKYGRKL